MKEALLTLANRVMQPFLPKPELKADGKNWSDLVQNRITEAQANGLPPRFVYLSPAGGCYFTVEAKGSRTLIFYSIYLNNAKDTPAEQAIVLDKNREPRYAHELKKLRLGGRKAWAISNEGKDTRIVGGAFHDFSKAELFDTRINDYATWTGQYPDVDGLIRILEFTEGQ
ncbi:MAG: hypothetical protein AAB662_03795 [Patescibacteria group bacterium]